MAYQELARTNPPKAAVGGNPHEVGVFPLDMHNAVLLDNVSPMNWKNPERPADYVYDMVAIGAGAGGLVTSEEAIARGFKAALIEKHMNGGDCLNIGCVPSKALLRSAKAIKETRNCAELGVEVTFQGVNFPKIMERLRARRAEIAPVDSASGAQERGTDMYFGEARFSGRHEVTVAGQTLRFRKAVIATGGSAFVPLIPGLKETPFVTNASLYNLTELPKRLVVIGAGPIGSEMAQAFAIFGSRVTVVADAFLPREDADASAIVREALHKDGVQFDLPCKVLKVEHSEGVFRVFTSTRSEPHEADVLLVAAGRKPNVDADLDKADVKFDVKSGVEINEFLQTSNPDVYSVGDCASKYNFTHVSAAMAVMAVENSLFGEKRSMKKMLIPWVTYTLPEIGHVGKYAQEVPGGVDTYVSPFEENDRAILEDAKEGFVKIHCAKGTDRIVGATIVSEHAGEMLHELSVCIQFGVSISALATVVHSYPTLACAIEGAANKYRQAHYKKAADAPAPITQNDVEAAAIKVRAVKAAGASLDEVKRAVDIYTALRSESGLSAAPEPKRAPASVTEGKAPPSAELEAASEKVRALKQPNASEAEVRAAVDQFRLQEAAEKVRAVKSSGADVNAVKAAVDAYTALKDQINRPSSTASTSASTASASAASAASAASTTSATSVNQDASVPRSASSSVNSVEEAAIRVRSLKANGATQEEVRAAVDIYNSLKNSSTGNSTSASASSSSPSSAHSALKAAAEKVRSLKASGAPTEEVKAAVDAYVVLSDAGEAKTSSAAKAASRAVNRSPALTAAAENVRALKAAGASQAEVESAVNAYVIEQAAETIRNLKAENAEQDEVRAACLSYTKLIDKVVPISASQGEAGPAVPEAGPVKTDLEIARDRVRTLKAKNASEAEVKEAARMYTVEEARVRVRSLKEHDAPVEEVKAAVDAYNALLTSEPPQFVSPEQSIPAPVIPNEPAESSNTDEASAVRLHMPQA